MLSANIKATCSGRLYPPTTLYSSLQEVQMKNSTRTSMMSVMHHCRLLPNRHWGWDGWCWCFSLLFLHDHCPGLPSASSRMRGGWWLTLIPLCAAHFRKPLDTKTDRRTPDSSSRSGGCLLARPLGSYHLQPYFLVDKKDLNRSLKVLPFHHGRRDEFIQPEKCFPSIDLLDAFFHVPIAAHHQPFLRVPLQAGGVNVLPYLDEWLGCAPCWAQVVWDTSHFLTHVAQLGLKVTWRTVFSFQLSGY